jgi:asparagine synthase (glutamine-hydrolysing)
MTGDVAQGAFLSGGMDSSVVVGVMSEISSTPVKTITLNFQDEGFNDGYYARLVADRFNTDHHEISLSKEEVLQHVEAGLKARDHPSKDGINSYVVSKAAKDAGLKVALTGIGGDELFGGYQYFKHMRLLYRNHWIWSEALNPLRRGLIRILSPSDRCTKLQKVSSLLHTDGSFQELYRRMRQFFFPNQIRELLTQDPNLDQIYDGRLMESFKKSKDLEETSRISIAEINSYLHDVLLRDTDQMGLAHSLELRVPLLDHDLVSYVVGLGDDVKTDGSNSKSLFVDAMEDYIPTEIKKRKSEGFRMPFERWLRNSLTGLAEEGLSRLAREPSFETTTVHDYWRRFLNHDSALTASRILLLVSLGHWLNQIDRLADQPEIQN